MNSINIPNNNNEKYIQLTNNIIYQNIHQYYCPSCHSPICNCNNNYFNSKKSEIIYHNFNTENEQQHNSLFIVDPTNLNKKEIKSKSIHVIPFNNNTLSSKNLQKKSINYNFKFYNNKNNHTIYQNVNMNSLDQIKNDFYANSSNITLNNRNINNHNRQNGIIFNRRFSPNFNNIKNIDFGNNNDKGTRQDSSTNNNRNILSCRNSKKNIFNENYNPINIDKKIKYRKIFNIKQINQNNKSIGKNSYDSHLNIHLKKSNNINLNSCRRTNNKIKRCITPFINSKYSNKTKKNLLKTANISIITNNNFNILNLQNDNDNNNQNTLKNQINNLNLIDKNHNFSSIEIMKNYQQNICNSPEEKDHIKNILCLKKNITLDLDTIHSEKTLCDKKPNTNRYTNNDNNNVMNKLFNNNLQKPKEIINKYYSNDKVDDSNKENLPNVNYDSPLNNKKFNNKINIEIHEKIKKNYNQKKKLSFFNGKNSDINYIKNSITNNRIKEENQNLNIEINDYKQKTEELMTLLQKANNEITQLKKELNGYKKQSNQPIGNININNFYHSNKYINNINNDAKNNFKKNSLKIKIPCGNKNQMDKYNSIISNKKLFLKNSQKTFQNHTVLNTSNSNKSNYNIYRNTYSNIDKLTDNNKYIFSIFCYRNKNFKNAILCFDAETKLFKIKNIIDNNSCNFNKNFIESINENNNISNSIYLINDNNYYIVTGTNCNKFYEYNFDTNRMKQFSDLKYSHSNGAMISYCNKIICLSGDLTKKVEIYSEEDNTWLELPEMQVERNFFSASIIKNRYLFAFFGYNLPSKSYLNTIEYFDIVNYNINVMNMRITNNINENVYWKNLEYNYFNCIPSFNNINLVGAISINYKNEKIIFLGGKNGLYDDNEEGYYQLILDDTNIKSKEITGYIEKIKTKDLSSFNNCYYFNFSYKYIEELNQDNILKEPAFVAFDNNHFVHLVKLSTMNHEIYNYIQ